MTSDKEFWTIFYFNNKSVLPSVQTGWSRKEYQSLIAGDSYATEGDVLIIVHNTAESTQLETRRAQGGTWRLLRQKLVPRTQTANNGVSE